MSFADLIINGWAVGSDIELVDPGTSVDGRTAKLIIGQTSDDVPTDVGVEFSAYVQHSGKGDNTTFRGIGGGVFIAKDLSTVTGADKGVLYAIEGNVVPIVDRNNSPFDDVVALALFNSGPAIGTDCFYVGRGRTDNPAANDFHQIIQIDGWAEKLFRASGHYTDGISLSSATITGSAIKLASGQKILLATTSIFQDDTAIKSLDANGGYVRFGGNAPVFRKANAIAESFSRMGINAASQSILTTGDLQFIAISLLKGQVVSKIGFVSGSVPANVPTNQWFALWDSSANLLGTTSDDTNNPWGAGTSKLLTMSAPYTVLADGLYYVSCMVKATTPPSLLGLSSSSTMNGFLPVLAAVDTVHTGLTNPASCPATASFTQVGGQPYAWIE